MRLAAGILGIVLLACLGIWAYVETAPGTPRLPEVLQPSPTTGSIYVSGPQVYTRERLVNDRYREDAWLLEELNHSKELTFGVTAHVYTSNAVQVSGTFNVGQAAPAATAGSAAAAGGTAPPPAGGTTPAAADATAGKTAPAAVTIDISPFDRFKARRAYREQIRSLIIENQLDDRHDLRGNSLYRLGFDVAVLPGGNTRANAKVTVSVLPPDGLLGSSVTDLTNNQALRVEEAKLAGLRNLSSSALNAGEQKASWERLYMRWLDSVEKRFDDGRGTLQRAFTNNRFTPEDYDILLAGVRDGVRYFWQPLDQLREQLAKFPYARKTLDAHQSLLDQIENEDPALINPDEATRHTLSGYRTEYVAMDETKVPLVHEAYRAEISRLMKTVDAESDLMVELSYYKQEQDAENAKSAGASKGNDNANSQPNDIAAPLPAAAPGAVPSAREQQAALDALGCGDLGTYGSLPPPSEPFAPRTLSYFLDKAFEPKLFKSVLGLESGSLRMVSPAGQGIRTKNLIYLDQLASIGTSYGAPGVAFTFQRQTVPLVLSDDQACFPPTLKSPILSATFNGITAYYLKKNLEDIALLLSNYDPNSDIESVTAEWAAAIAAAGSTGPRRAHVSTKNIDVGLINFIRTAGRRLDAFSYALAPSEPDELTEIQAQDERNRSLAAQVSAPISALNVGAGVGLGNQSASNQNRIDARKVVVGFGAQPNSAIATFGWVIPPREPVGPAAGPAGVSEYRQTSSQMSLTALVSLPAWLEEVRVKITPSWTDLSDAGDRPTGAPAEYTVELPVNFETVDASLFETNDRSPTIFEWDTDSKTIRACEPVDILIPGARLWRSTVVTLGSQKADEIYVLPDMNGIIASFRPVQFPSTWSDLSLDFHAPLTVWTSQGSTTVPIYITFKALGKDAKPPVCAAPGTTETAVPSGTSAAPRSGSAQPTPVSAK